MKYKPGDIVMDKLTGLNLVVIKVKENVHGGSSMSSFRYKGTWIAEMHVKEKRDSLLLFGLAGDIFSWFDSDSVISWHTND